MSPFLNLALQARVPVLVAVLVLAHASLARAHGLEAGQLELQLEGKRLRIAATPPASSFPGQDAEHDGLFSFDEMRKERAALRLAFERAVVLTDDRGQLPRCERADISAPTPPGASQTDHLRFIQACVFAEPPRALLLSGTGFSEPLLLHAVRLRPNAQGQLEPVSTPQEAVFRGAGPLALLGEGAEREAAAVGWSSSSFVLLGVRHVLEGPDHLLFIAALLLGARTLSRLGAGVTAFTLGHTLALVAVVSAAVPAPSPGWVEPCIALSIALTAALELTRRAPAARGRLALAFVFGSVHGAGLAGSALSTFAGSPTWLLAPFALGAELAQLLVAGFGFVVLGALLSERRRMTAAVVLTGVGVVWFALRVAGAAA